MKPNPSNYNPDAIYLRSLIEKTGLSQRKAAMAIGIKERNMRDLLNPDHPSRANYPVQYALEQLWQGLDNAEKVGLEIYFCDDMIEVWEGDQFKGKGSSIDFVIDLINLKLSCAQDKKDAEAKALDAATAGFTDAAILKNGRVIGCCKAGKTRYIEVAGDISADGNPVNVEQLTISKSKKNIELAQECRFYDCNLIDEALIYLSE